MLSRHELPLDTPILYLKCDEAFNKLTSQERKLAHHLSRAAWWGGLIVLCQKSPETPIIFNVLTRLVRSEHLQSLKETAQLKAGFNEDEFNNLFIYFSTFMYNQGNYLGFGDSKFVPTVSKEKFEKLIRASKAYGKAPAIFDKFLSEYLDQMYCLDEDKKFLGLAPNGITMYFTPNCPKEDADLTNKYLTAKNIEAFNTRIVKKETPEGLVFDIRTASVDKGPQEGITSEVEEFEGAKFCRTRGDYSAMLKRMNVELDLAKEFTANDLEKKMLDKYIESFSTGSIKAHKEGSIFWVKNKSPAVETYMGFIEVYTDPTNQRAEFEFFVAVVNREQSRKFDELVNRSEEEFLHLLPWGSDFEEDVFSRPDFSSLDILSFATSGCPIGINIPNYKDVKEEEGFKNVVLLNVMSSRSAIKGAPFLNDVDRDLKEKHGTLSMEIQVGLHELLGHGCGKFLRRKDNGSLNFDPVKVKNPFNGDEATFYETGQSFNSAFTDLASAYEECRAETVALYLGLVDPILDIFSVKPEDREDIKYTMWLDMFYAGLRGLEMYQPTQGKWGQAHCQARYVLLRVALEAGDNFVTIEEITGEDGLPDLIMSVDRSKIVTVGEKAMGIFLKKLQVYRSMGDSVNGRAMFEKYAQVPDDGPHPFKRWHEIVTRKRRPRMVLAMPNTKLVDDTAEIVPYEDGYEGLVKSWVDRFTAEEYDEAEGYLSNFVEGWTK